MPHLDVPGRAALTALGLRRHPILALFAALFIGIGVTFATLPWLMHDRDARLAAQGERVEATVIELRDDFEPGEVGGARDLEIEYAFALPGGGRATGWTVAVSRADYESVEVGDLLTVVYDPADPSHSFAVGNGLDSDGGTSALEAALFSVLGVGFLSLGGLFAWGLLVRMPNAWLRLTAEGASTQGEVSEVERSDGGRARIHYTFQDRFGTARRAQTEWAPAAVADSWSVGDSGAVRFDARDPERSVWLGRDDLDFYR